MVTFEYKGMHPRKKERVERVRKKRREERKRGVRTVATERAKAIREAQQGTIEKILLSDV